MKTIIQTHEEERYVIVSGDRFVSISREYVVMYSDPPRWRVDPDVGISVPREHVAAFVAAMSVPSPSDGEPK